jgi:hypothetical protein
MAKRKLDSLLEYARANGMSDADLHALHTMFWRIWAHPDLIGFPLVADSLRQIGLLATRMWNEQLTLFGMERWPFLLKWLADHGPSICSEIGIDDGIKPFSIGKNPMERRGFEADAVYSALCETHALKGYEEKYRLLQGHVLFAFSLALGELSSLETYQEVCQAIRDSGKKELKQNGEAIREPLPYPCYRVGYALRRLSRDKPAWTTLLGVLEVNRSPSSFAAWIGAFELVPGTIESKEAREDFRFIQNFLVGIYKDQWKKVVRRAGGTRESTTRDSVHGTVEFGLWGSVFTQTVDGSADQDDEFYYFINLLTEEEREQLGNSADDSDEGNEFFVTKSSNHGPPRQSSWKQNNRKMMANQFLPYDYDELNGSQLGLLWSGLDLWWKKVKPEDPSRELSRKELLTLEIGALLWVMLWTVSPISRAMCLDVPSNPDDQTESPLSLLITDDEKGEEIRSWRVKGLPPRADTECPNSRPVADHILLPDICGGSAWVIAFWRRKQNRAPAIFDRPLKEYQRRIGGLLREFREKNCIADPITAARYSKVLFWRILRQSGHDFSAFSLITGQDHSLNRSRLHYTTRQIADMQRLYAKCAQDLAGEIASVLGTQFHPIDFPIRESEMYLGAHQCPTFATVRTAVTTLRDRVRLTPQLQLPKSREERKAFARHHDELTLYTYWMFAFATGIRGIVAPYPRIELIDPQTGTYTIEDKTANSGALGYKRRVVRLPPVLLGQMQAYDAYLRGLKRKYQLEGDGPCFFLALDDEKLRPVAIRPVELQSRAEELLPFPANTQRLFLRSELLGRGCGAEIVDAFMGHWAFGEEPWAPYSTFNYAVYFDALKPYLGPLLKELGFEVVRKRIVS